MDSYVGYTATSGYLMKQSKASGLDFTDVSQAFLRTKLNQTT